MLRRCCGGPVAAAVGRKAGPTYVFSRAIAAIFLSNTHLAQHVTDISLSVAYPPPHCPFLFIEPAPSHYGNRPERSVDAAYPSATEGGGCTRYSTVVDVYG